MQKKCHERPKQYLNLKIDLDRIKIELGGENAYECLREVNKILDKVRAPLDGGESGFACFGEPMLSDELMLSKDVHKMLNNLAEIYPDHRTNRVAVENKKFVDLGGSKIENQLDVQDVKKGVARLLFDIQKQNVKRAVIHIKGSLAEQELRKVSDIVEQELRDTEISFVCTKSDIVTHTIIEGVFFGEFFYEEPDD